MNPNIVISAIAGLESLGNAQQQEKFREWIITILESIISQINTINYNQMQEVSMILTRMELLQYWTILLWLAWVVMFSYMYRNMSKRIKMLESKINTI